MMSHGRGLAIAAASVFHSAVRCRIDVLVNGSWMMMFPQSFQTVLVSLGLLLRHPNSPEITTAFASSSSAVSSAKACFGTW